jgi:hypothetical protein
MLRMFSIFAFAVATGIAQVFKIVAVPDPIILLAVGGVVVTAVLTIATPIKLAGLPVGFGSVAAVYGNLPGHGLPGLFLTSALGTCLLAGVGLWIFAGSAAEGAR